MPTERGQRYRRDSNVQDARGAAALGLVVPELSRMLAMRALLVMGGLIGTVAALE